MKKIIVGVVYIALLSPVTVLAAVDCKFVPSIVKVGAYGKNESYLFTCGGGSDNYCYNLGLGTDDQAQNRYSTAMAAMIAGKNIELKIHNETSCKDARTNKTVPNSTVMSNS